MKYSPEDARVALEIVAALSGVVLRLSGPCPEGGRALFVSGGTEMLFYTRQELLAGQVEWGELIHPEDRAVLAARARDMAAHGQAHYVCAYRVRAQAGHYLPVRDERSCVYGENGRLAYVDCVVQDDTELVQACHRLENSLRQQRMLGETMQAVHMAKPDDAFGIVLGQAGRHLNITRATLFEELPAQGQACVTSCWSKVAISTLSRGRTVDFASQLPAAWALLQRGEPFVAQEGQVRGPWLMEGGMCAAVAIPVNCGSQRYGFALFEDRDTHRQWQMDHLVFLRNIATMLGTVLRVQYTVEQAQRSAQQDPLTGLISRHRFDAQLEKAIEEARQSRRYGYVLFTDMDDFKVINEGYGHRFGDALLVEVAHYLRNTYAEECEIFRIGADEFALILRSEHGEKAPRIIDEIQNKARHPWHVLNREFYCTMSLGAVRFPDGGMDVAEVVHNADIAVHSAKNLGKDNAVLFNHGMNMNSSSHERAEMERRMRACIENNFAGFEVYYQPVVDVRGSILGAEALLRWFDEDGKMTPPGDFIPLAEYLGLIIPLGNFVLRAAAIECRHINERAPDFSMSVNVSVRQLQNGNFLADLNKVLAETGVNPQNLTLEVTEGMLVQDIGQMQLLLEELRAMGMQIAMDDFGTGYSSLSNMRRLPLDVIKIDRSFVIDVTHDPYAQSFIQLIARLARAMGRKVCVEGVETAAQYSYCAESRVDRIQGHYFYKPMPRDELAASIT